MNWIKIFLVFLLFGIQKACGICTDEQSGKMASCTLEFIKSLGLQESENPVDIILKFMSSSSEIYNLCEKYKISKECMGPQVMKNCNELTAVLESVDLESVGDYMELAFKFMNIGGQYVCEEYNSEIKELYSCALLRCEIDSSSCETIQSTIDECVEESQDLCPKRVLPFLKPVLKARECLKMPECEFCDPKIAEKIKQYSEKNMKSRNDDVLEFIKDPLHAKAADFDETQIAHIVEFLQMKDYKLQQGALVMLLRIATSGTSKQKKLIFQLNIIPTLCKMLNQDYTKDDEVETDRRIVQFSIIYLLHAKVDGVIEQFAQNGGEEILKEFINSEDKDIKFVANLFLEKLDKYFEKQSSSRNFQSKFEDGLKETTEFLNGIANSDDEVQLSALKEYRKLLARGKISTNAGAEAEGGIIPILGKLLSSKKLYRTQTQKNAVNFWSFFKVYKLLVQTFQYRYATLSNVDDLGGDAMAWQIIPHAEIQAESAWILKYFVKDHLNAIVEEDVIPALIRTLVSTDAKVLEHSIETLAVIIEQQPKLRNIFMEFNIVEPLLMSYSDEIGKEALEKIAAILARLIQQKVPEQSVLPMVPVLSELIYTYDSNTLIQIIPALLIEDTQELIDKHFINLLIGFLESNNENIRGSACVMLSYAADDKDRLQYILENGVLHKITEKFIDGNGYNVLFFTSMVAKHGNTKHFDELLSTPLISFFIKLAKQDDDMTEPIILTFHLLISKGTSRHHDALLKLDIITFFMNSLKISKDEHIQNKIINLIRRLLKRDPRILTKISESDGIKVIRKFESSIIYDLRRDASKLLKEIGIDSDSRREMLL